MVSRRDKLVHLMVVVRLVAMDHRVRTDVSLPLTHMIPRQKKFMARKFTGVECASIGTTLTLWKHMSEVQARNPLKTHQLKPTWDSLMTHLLGSWTLVISRISFIA
jgi:hypothetical protein